MKFFPEMLSSLSYRIRQTQRSSFDRALFSFPRLLSLFGYCFEGRPELQPSPRRNHTPLKTCLELDCLLYQGLLRCNPALNFGLASDFSSPLRSDFLPNVGMRIH